MMKVRIGDEEGLLFADAFRGSHAKLFSFIPRTTEKEPELTSNEGRVQDQFVKIAGFGGQAVRFCREQLGQGPDSN